MGLISVQGGEAARGGLRHLAFFYRDQGEYRARIMDFARAGLAQGEPSPIALPGDEARPVRRLVESHAGRARLAEERAADLVLAASEVAANTLSHARSDGMLHVWRDDQEVLCQLHDQGWITDPLAGRVRHGPESRGHGLFLVNQVCDLVELITGREGTTVCLHMRLPAVTAAAC